MRGSTTGRRLSQFELDVMLAVGVFAAEVTGAAIAANQDPGGPPFRWWGASLMAIAATALVFRQRRPFLVSLIVGLATGTYGVASFLTRRWSCRAARRAVRDRILSDRRVVALVAVLAGVGALVGTMATGDSGLDDYYRNFLPEHRRPGPRRPGSGPAPPTCEPSSSGRRTSNTIATSPQSGRPPSSAPTSPGSCTTWSPTT